MVCVATRLYRPWLNSAINDWKFCGLLIIHWTLAIINDQSTDYSLITHWFHWCHRLALSGTKMPWNREDVLPFKVCWVDLQDFSFLWTFASHQFRVSCRMITGCVVITHLCLFTHSCVLVCHHHPPLCAGELTRCARETHLILECNSFKSALTFPWTGDCLEVVVIELILVIYYNV